MRPLALVVLLLVPPACASADHVETDASGALPPPAVPTTDHAVLSLPTQTVVRAPDAVTPAVLDDRPSGRVPIMATSFEPASAVCNDWTADGADAIRSVPPRSGTYACRVCATGAAPDLALVRESGAVAAGRYTLRAWVRNRPRREAPDNVTARLDAETEAGTVTATSPVVVPGDDYAEVFVTIALPQGATAIRARIGATATAAQCVLVDDVVLERVP